MNKNAKTLITLSIILLLSVSVMAFRGFFRNPTHFQGNVSASLESEETENSDESDESPEAIPPEEAEEGEENEELHEAEENQEPHESEESAGEAEEESGQSFPSEEENDDIDFVTDTLEGDMQSEIIPNFPFESPTKQGENPVEISSEASLIEPLAMPSDSIVVYNFDQFKSALSENNGYVNIYLGADINMKALGIEIHTSKKSVSISGINPLNGQGPFTIDEYNSLDPVYTIRVALDSGAKYVTLKNVNVIGRNFYGAICIFDAASDVNVTFENVNYNGPQLCYNRGGTVRITGNSQIDIVGGNGLSAANELVEANSLELGGNTVINHYAPVVSGLWLVGSNSSLKVLADSEITWNETGTYMIFQDNSTPAAFTMEENSGFTLKTANGIFYNNSVTYHQFGDFFLDSGASFTVIQEGVATYPLMKIKNSLQISQGASFALFAENAPELILMTGTADIDVKNPDTFVLYNKNNRLIKWENPAEHKISIVSTFLNLWNTPCEIAQLGGFDDSPLYRWRKLGGKDLSVEINVASNAAKSVSSNYEEEDYGLSPSLSAFDMNSARIITAGKMRLNLDIVTDTSSYISGESEPGALIKAIYTDADGNIQTIFTQADSGGAFIADIKNSSLPLADSQVTVYSSLGYKNVFEITTVVNTEDDVLRFIHLPSELLFPKTAISASRLLIPRADENWHIIIEDTRKSGSEWGLFARLKEPLSGYKSGEFYPIENAVVFKNPDGKFSFFSKDPIKISEGKKTDQSQILIGWPADEGIMLDVDMLEVYSDLKYKATIEWLLTDAP